MYRGHDPREVREYDSRDLELFMAALPVIREKESLGGVKETHG